VASVGNGLDGHDLEPDGLGVLDRGAFLMSVIGASSVCMTAMDLIPSPSARRDRWGIGAGQAQGAEDVFVLVIEDAVARRAARET
jgi:hypothetical protein